MSGIGWSVGFAQSGGEDIYYETAGDGDTVLFCHGLGGNHAVWYQQVPVFAKAFRTVAWDQRGFGMSTNTRGESVPAAAARDLEVLLDQLSVDRAHLVGQSMGGWAVMGFALRSPDRVASLVVCDSTAGVWTEPMREFFEGREARTARRATIGSHSAVGEALRQRDMVKAFLYQQIGGFRRGVEDGEMIARLFSTRYDLDEVAALRMPVLLVVGADDQLIPPAAVNELTSVIAHAKLVEIPDAGHSPYFEQPKAWNDAVLSFLESL